jgi:hypothetical protein
VSDRVERLLTLAAIMERVPVAQFTMSWGIPYMPTGRKKVGCPLGWAASVPAFKADGLRTETSEEGLTVLRFNEAVGLEAARQFFGLSVTETWNVFTPDCYLKTPEVPITPQLVASKLRLLARTPA